MANAKNLTRSEFGDFQTPPQLAARVCTLVATIAPNAASILEPTCGIGHFLFAAMDAFPAAEAAVGVEINSAYVERLVKNLQTQSLLPKARIINASFFDTDWLTLRSSLREPILIIGNPPWVTNSTLGVLGSVNVPEKSNFQGQTGLDALTGKSNFDISESMIRRLLDQFSSSDTTIAFLCKTIVARKILNYSWSSDLPIYEAQVRRIDAALHFGASVEACLLLIRTGKNDSKKCQVYSDIDDVQPSGTIAYSAGQVLADLSLYNRWKHLQGPSTHQWRSGVKHDCSKIMEFREERTGLVNGLGELVDLEETYLFPLLKTSDIANSHLQRNDRSMLLPQRSVGEDTTAIRLLAPKTWEYLEKHASALDTRASSIYKHRPRFSIFGVGPYTFSLWKVAISGLYKKLHFVPVGPWNGKPRVLDDTTYFLSCESESEAFLLVKLLTSEPAVEFFSARVFWDAKRPITADLLSKLSLPALSRELASEDEFQEMTSYLRVPRLQAMAIPTNLSGRTVPLK